MKELGYLPSGHWSKLSADQWQYRPLSCMALLRSAFACGITTPDRKASSENEQAPAVVDCAGCHGSHIPHTSARRKPPHWHCSVAAHVHAPTGMPEPPHSPHSSWTFPKQSHCPTEVSHAGAGAAPWHMTCHDAFGLSETGSNKWRRCLDSCLHPCVHCRPVLVLAICVLDPDLSVAWPAVKSEVKPLVLERLMVTRTG